MVEEAERIETNYFKEYMKQLKNLQTQYPQYHPTVLHIIADEKTQETMKKRTENTHRHHYNIFLYQIPRYPP